MANEIKTREVLKEYFETGDKPNQEQYWSLIDSLRHAYDDIPFQYLDLEGYHEENTRATDILLKLGDYDDSSNGTKLILDDATQKVSITGDLDASGGTITANSFVGDGSQLTNLPAGNLTGDVAYKDSDNNFSSDQTFVENVDINGNLTTSGNFLVSKNGSELSITGDGNSSHLQSKNSQPLVINDLGNDLILTPNSSSVGIGTSTPTKKLDVVGEGRFSQLLTADGGVEATTFTGDGAGLTNVEASTLNGLQSTDFALTSDLKISIADGNNVEQYEVDIFNGEKLKFNGFNFNQAEKTFSPTLSFKLDTYYLDSTLGDDNTGTIGISALPYATFDAILANISPDQQLNRVFTIEIMNNDTYEVLTTFPSANNYVIKSDFACTITFENNPNADLFISGFANVPFQILMPLGKLILSTNIAQRFQNVSLRMDLDTFECRHVGVHSIFQLFTQSGRIKIKNTILGCRFANRTTSNIEPYTIADFGIIETVSGGTTEFFNTYFTTSALGRTNVKISRVFGDGNIVLASDTMFVEVGDINITGNVTIVNGRRKCGVHFNDSTITANYVSMFTDVKEAVISGKINQASTTKIDWNSNGRYEDATITFKELIADFTKIRMYRGNLNLNIHNCKLTFETIPFQFATGNYGSIGFYNVNLYGTNTFLSNSPTQLCQSLTIMDGLRKVDFKNYGKFTTNIRATGEDNTYNDVVENFENLSNYVDNAAAVAGGLSAGDEYYNTTNNAVELVV